MNINYLIMRSLLSLLLLIPFYCQAQGIQFKNISIDEAEKIAQKEQKGIFISIGTSWCPNCNWMENEILDSKKVGNFINDNYVSLSIDAESKKGIKIVEQLQLHTYPAYIYLQNDGTPLHLTVGEMTEADFIKTSKQAENPHYQYFTLKKKIESSKSISTEDLAHYINTSYATNTNDSIQLQKFLNDITDEDIENKDIWSALKQATIHLGLHSEPTLYVIKHAKIIEDKYGVKEIIVTINNAAKVSMRPFVANRDVAGWQELMSFLEDKLGKQGETLNFAYNPTFYLNIKDYATAYNKMEQGVSTLSDRDKEVKGYLYRNWAFNVYQYYNDEEKLKAANNWIDSAIEIHENSMNLETKAGLLFKLKEYDSAKEYALKAIDLSKKEKVHALVAHTVLHELEEIN
ncbi:DUF255 domain-containing protein [Flammeovirga kamogawensis]|nr:DUF255 domain-containing protein [Flammeovirga kamogawensis]